MPNYPYPVRAVSAVNFTEALAAGALSAMNNLGGVPPFGSGRFFIRAIEVLATENFGPEFHFFSSAAGFTGDPLTDTFMGRFGFQDVMGEQSGGAGLWRYYNDGMAIPYLDQDAISIPGARALHVKLGNLSAIAKVINTPFRATFWVEPAF